MSSEREDRIVATLQQIGLDIKELQARNPFMECRNSGRVTCYTDNRWVSASDDNYGTSYYQFNENAGTNADPLVEWEHNGDVVQAGTLFKSVTIVGQSNDPGSGLVEGVEDLTVSVQLKTPNPITRWESGVDADGEVTTLELVRFDLMDGVTGANTNDKRGKTVIIPLDHALVTEMSELSFYFKPSGTRTANDYYRLSYMFEYYRTAVYPIGGIVPPV